MEKGATIIALSGKGGVGKTSVSAAIVKLLTEAYPDKRILAIDIKAVARYESGVICLPLSFIPCK